MDHLLTAERGSCRPGGCAGLCTDEGLRAAHERYRSRLLGVARRILGDAALAEEAVQEAMVRAWRACSSYDPCDGPPLVGWLLALTRNAAIDLARWRARRPPVATFSDSDDSRRDASDLDHSDLLTLRTELVDALRTLGAGHRHVIVETLLRDRSAAEVACELGIPPGTVRSRVHYALRHLRVTLEAPNAWA